jgi:hypothetical protein
MPSEPIYHEQAIRELQEAHAIGLKEWPHLVAGLRAEFESKISYILEDPIRPRPIENEWRRVNLKRFPYHIIYMPWEDSIWVLAFAHDCGAPLYWKGRLKDWDS